MDNKEGIPIICAKCGERFSVTDNKFILKEYQYVEKGRVIDTVGCLRCIIDDKKDKVIK